MNQNRYLLCLLLAGWMIYYSLPKLEFINSGAKGVFAMSWILFAIIVVAGNLTALLYSPVRRKNKPGSMHRKNSNKKVRSFD